MKFFKLVKTEPTNTESTAAAVSIIIPYVGVIGLQDFAIGDWKMGLSHIGLVLAGLLIIQFVPDSQDISPYMWVFGILILLSYIISLIECIIILSGRRRAALVKGAITSTDSTIKQQEKNSTKTLETPLRDEVYPTKLAEEESNVKGPEALSRDKIYPSKLTEEEKAKREQENRILDQIEQRYVNKAMLSLVLSLVPFLVILVCLVLSGGETKEVGRGGVWWAVLLYLYLAALPVAIFAVINGIAGLKSPRSRGMAITSLTIVAVSVVGFLVFLASVLH